MSIQATLATPSRRRVIPLFVVYAVLAALAFATRGVVQRAETTHFPLELLMFMQSALSAPMMWAVCKWQKKSLLPAPSVVKGYVSRIVWGIVYQAMLLLAIMVMPLALATTLSYTTPLFIALLAPFLLKERSTVLIAGLTLIGFIGVAFNAMPYLGQVPRWALVVGLGCGLAGAFMQVGLRRLAAQGEPSIRGVFWLHAVSAVLALIVCLFRGSLNVSLSQVGVCFVIAALSCLAQLSQATAYFHGKAVPVNALSLLTLPLTIMMAHVTLHESVSPLSMLGIVIVLPACLLLVWAEQVRLRKEHDKAHAVDKHVTMNELREEHAQLESGLSLPAEPLFISEPTVAENRERDAALRAAVNRK